MARLIVNADDLGLTGGVNAGIYEAHTRGIVTSASLMVGGPAAAAAAGELSAHSELSIGLHFVEDRTGVLDDPGALARTFAAQLDRFRRLTRRDPTHVDSHHHVHLSRMNAFTALVEPLGVPLRGDGRVPYVGGFYAEGGELERVGPAQLLESVRAHVRADLVELGCHPGRVTGELVSSYAEPREVELATLTEPQLRRELEDAGFELVSFADVSKEVRAR